MENIRTVTKYFTKDDIYDAAGYRRPKLPKGAQVQFLGKYTNFYDKVVKISYEGLVYYTKPEVLKKQVITTKSLKFATIGCYAQHPYYNTVILSAKIVTEDDYTEEGKEFWIARDKDGHYHIIEVGDCQSLYQILEQHDEPVTYNG